MTDSQNAPETRMGIDRRMVLLVDDQPNTVRILKKRLQEPGKNIVVCSTRTIDQALIMLTQASYQLLIIDLYLPTDWKLLNDRKSKIKLTPFNQGELLGDYAQEREIPYFFYTSNPAFYQGDDPNKRVVSKSEPIDAVLNRVWELLEVSP